MSLKETAIKGARWGVIENFSATAIQFVVSCILARWFLSPAEYGLVGCLTIFIAISVSFIDNGFSAALIRKQNPLKEDISTAFIINFTMGVVCFLILFALAPLVARYFGEPQLVALLRVLSIVLIVNALSMVQKALAVKAIDFKKLTKCTAVAALISGAIGIYMAFKGCGVWSIVGQQISNQVVNTSLLWFYGSWKINFRFSGKSFKELFSYGSNIMLAGLLDTVFRKIYYPVIGRAFGAGLLGQYTRADQFSNVCASNLTQIVQKVSFPVLSKAIGSTERLCNAFRSTLKVTALVCLSIGFIMSALAAPFIVGLIGERWFEAAKILSITALCGAFYPLHGLSQNILQIKGRMGLYVTLEILKKVLIIASIIVGWIFKDLYVMLWGSVVASAAVMVINAFFASRALSYAPYKLMADFCRPLLASLLGAFVARVVCRGIILLITNALDVTNLTILNLSGVAIGGICAVCAILLFYRAVRMLKISEASEIEEVKTMLGLNKQNI